MAIKQALLGLNVKVPLAPDGCDNLLVSCTLVLLFWFPTTILGSKLSHGGFLSVLQKQKLFLCLIKERVL